MSKYIFSNKINPLKTLVAFLVAIPAAILIGFLYGGLTNWCTFIIIDLIIYALVIVLVTALAKGIVRLGAVRNKTLKLLVSILIVVLTWYSAWSYIVNKHDLILKTFNIERTFSKIAHYLDTRSLSFGKATSSSAIDIEGAGLWIFYGLEALLFLVPVLMVFAISRDYYCETCKTFNEEEDFYIEGLNESTLLASESAGNFNEITNFSRRTTVPSSTSEISDYSKPIFKIELSWCKKCKQNGVINVHKGVYERDKNSKISYNGKPIIKDTLVSDSSIAKLIE